jgi:uncharacterized protein YcbX
VEIKVVSLHSYPVKSCKGTDHNELELLQTGFRNDRRWMLVDSVGRFMSQRRNPTMALIMASVEGNLLTLRSMNMPEITVAGGSGRTNVLIHRTTCVVADMGDDVAFWLEAALGVPCRLVSMALGEKRVVSKEYALSNDDEIQFQDAFPIHLISEASLVDLNTRLISPVPMSRFRCNIIIKGCGPYEEDRWKVIKIGELVLHVAKPCGRCVMTSIDQNTGEKVSNPPLATLAKYRNHKNEVIFGQYLIHEREGALSVGDSVEIIS